MSAPAKPRPAWRVAAREAVAFWEPARLPYTLIITITVALWLLDLRAVLPAPWMLLAAAILGANLLYCAVYPADVLLQLANPRSESASWRRIMLFAGTFVVWTLVNMAFWLLHVFGPLVEEYR